MWLARSALALAVTGVAAAGCGSGGRGSLTHDVTFDVGGRVGHLLHPDRPLSGATVTLTDVGEDTETATTASNGLWTEANLRPGPYIERFELAGYEPMERELILAVGGENDIENVFVGSPDAFLQETRLRATSSPFGVEIRSGETYRDGFSGHVLQYSVAAHGSITLTFDRDVIDADGDLEDGETNQNVGASFDSATRTLTFDAADIDTMNGGGTPITTDTDPWTWHRIDVDAFALTPLDGDPEFFAATLFFNAVP